MSTIKTMVINNRNESRALSFKACNDDFTVEVMKAWKQDVETLRLAVSDYANATLDASITKDGLKSKKTAVYNAYKVILARFRDASAGIKLLADEKQFDELLLICGMYKKENKDAEKQTYIPHSGMKFRKSLENMLADCWMGATNKTATQIEAEKAERREARRLEREAEKAKKQEKAEKKTTKTKKTTKATKEEKAA